MPFPPISPSVLAELLTSVNQLAKTAGERIMEIYSTADFAVQQKSDDSPLTRADMASHETIITGLQQLTPVYPILSEESTDIPYTERAQWSHYWLVDPLDGTREFISCNGEFTVNIALIEQQKPVLGVIYVPVTGISYFAAVGNGVFKSLPQQLPQPISVRTCPQDKLIVAGSRSHASQSLHDFIDQLKTKVAEVELVSIGSSLKFCLVAEGKADIYPRFGSTSEWDTAAAQCIVEQAGGYLVDLQLNPLSYNTKESLINPHFIVYSDPRCVEPFFPL